MPVRRFRIFRNRIVIAQRKLIFVYALNCKLKLVWEWVHGEERLKCGKTNATPANKPYVRAWGGADRHNIILYG